MPTGYRSAARVGSYRGKQGAVGDTETNFLAFHIAAGLQGTYMLIGPRQKRIAARLRPIGNGDARKKQNRHSCPHRPSMALGTGHATQRVSEAGADRENRQHLDEVGQRRWILKRMSTVSVEESAAVRTKLFDHF